LLPKTQSIYYSDQESQAPLVDYLQQDKEKLHDLGLNPKRGNWYNSAHPEHGDILFLPPTEFTAEQVDHLASCIRANQFKIKDAFINTRIDGRAYWGLVKTRTRLYRYDGIAYLVYADSLPIAGAYQ